MSEPVAPIEALADRFADAVLGTHSYRGDDTVLLRRERLHEAARFLKEEPTTRMNVLMDLTVVDYATFGESPPRGFFFPAGVDVRPSSQVVDEDPWPGPPEGGRFAVVYHFFSTVHKHRLRVVVAVGEEDAAVDTLTDLWAGANWLEREAWDMFGVEFRGHPDMRRILMYEEFEGHPLRKDYPVMKRQPLVEPTS